MSMATTPILKANPLLLSLKQKQKRSFFLPLSSSLVRFTKLSASTNCSTNNTQLYNSRLLLLVNNNKKKSNTEKEIPTPRAGAKIVNDVVDFVYKKILMGIKVSTVTLLLGLGLSLVMFGGCNLVMAASCGRMGGYPSSSSSSSSSSRTSSSSRAYLYSYSSSEESDESESITSSREEIPVFLSLCGVFCVFVVFHNFVQQRLSEGGDTSVLMIQVATSREGPFLRRDLNRICENADTSTLNGLSKLLQETLIACCIYSNYWSSSYSYVHFSKSTEDARILFMALSNDIRRKSDAETLTNVNNKKEKKMKSVRNQSANGFSVGYTMITIMVAVEGVHELPTINGKGDLEKAFQKLYSIQNKIQGVEVLWTPQYEDEILSEKELRENYPFLRPL